MEVTFVDALGPYDYASIDVPGRSRQTLTEPRGAYSVTAAIVRGHAREIGTASAKPTIVARDDVRQLLHALADDPDDDHNREVLIDLLADIGETCAAVFAQLRMGEQLSLTKRKAALGPLANFFKPLEFDRGLPSSATIMQNPPSDPSVVAALVADLRLGMLNDLRLGRGSNALYIRLLASGALISLRSVDISRVSMLRALKEASYAHLTRLRKVRFGDPAVTALLADRAFDSVHELELDLEDVALSQTLINKLASDDDGVLAASPRHLIFVQGSGQSAAVARIVFRQIDLINATVTVGGVTAGRIDGELQVNVATDAHWDLRNELPEILANLE